MQVRICSDCGERNPISQFTCQKCGRDILASAMEFDYEIPPKKMYLICPVCQSHIELESKETIIKECPVCHDYQIHSWTENDIRYENSEGKFAENSILTSSVKAKTMEKEKTGRQIEAVKMISSGDGVEIVIPEGEFVLGAEGDISAEYFFSDKYIGRKHCTMRVSKRHVFIQDNDSLNYTLVNGKKIRKPDGNIEITDGDKITMADKEFEIQICW